MNKHMEQDLSNFTQSVSKVTDALNAQAKQIMQQVGILQNHSESQQSQAKVTFEEQLNHLTKIRHLLEDQSVSDILINGPKSVFIERRGVCSKADVEFDNDAQVLEMAKTIALHSGRVISHEYPMVDARLMDGSRVNIVAPPLTVDGTCISIRKFSKAGLSLGDMVRKHTISEQIAHILKIAAACKISILVSGGTGSGKTTMLNALSRHINPKERIVVIEDSAELNIKNPDKVRLEAKPQIKGEIGSIEVTIRDLVKNSLRMRPDRIIVGETRGPEAFDMIQAMNTGHSGSMTTLHANSPRDALTRLENMIGMTNYNMPQKSVRQQIASAVAVIIQLKRLSTGQRVVTHISEVTGTEGDTIAMQDIFTYKGDKQFAWNEIMPRFSNIAIGKGYKEQLNKALGTNL